MTEYIRDIAKRDFANWIDCYNWAECWDRLTNHIGRELTDEEMDEYYDYWQECHNH